MSKKENISLEVRKKEIKLLCEKWIQKKSFSWTSHIQVQLYGQ